MNYNDFVASALYGPVNVSDLYQERISQLITDEPNFMTIDAAVSGLCGECGEVADILKKIKFHGNSLNSERENLLLEIGDVYFYLTLLRQAIGVTQEEIEEMNRAKLVARLQECQYRPSSKKGL